MIRFYLDENVPLAVAIQLTLRGMDVVTVQGLGLRGDTDMNHLINATDMERVLCTYDSDYVELATNGLNHAGIVKGIRVKHSVGDWVKGLTNLHLFYDEAEMKNRVEYLSQLV
jgi:hypothetical protein